MINTEIPSTINHTRYKMVHNRLLWYQLSRSFWLISVMVPQKNQTLSGSYLSYLDEENPAEICVRRLFAHWNLYFAEEFWGFYKSMNSANLKNLQGIIQLEKVPKCLTSVDNCFRWNILCAESRFNNYVISVSTPKD